MICAVTFAASESVAVHFLAANTWRQLLPLHFGLIRVAFVLDWTTTRAAAATATRFIVDEIAII
jgi:hypothetical protein